MHFFLFPRFLKVSLGPILAIFHIANVFLVGFPFFFITVVFKFNSVISDKV